MVELKFYSVPNSLNHLSALLENWTLNFYEAASTLLSSIYLYIIVFSESYLFHLFTETLF